MKPTEIVPLAADAAAFMRALLAEGLTPPIAVQLTQTFLQTRMIGDIATEEPKSPWQEPGA